MIRVSAAGLAARPHGQLLAWRARFSKAIGPDDAVAAWDAFLALGIEFMQAEAVSRRAWALAEQLGLPTLYDAAFLAVAELAPGGPVPFWTADRELAQGLVDRCPHLVRLLA